MRTSFRAEPLDHAVFNLTWLILVPCLHILDPELFLQRSQRCEQFRVPPTAESYEWGHLAIFIVAPDVSHSERRSSQRQILRDSELPPSTRLLTWLTGDLTGSPQMVQDGFQRRCVTNLELLPLGACESAEVTGHAGENLHDITRGDRISLLL